MEKLKKRIKEMIDEEITGTRKQVMIDKNPHLREGMNKGDICWSCSKVIKNPKKHYPYIAGMFCKE